MRRFFQLLHQDKKIRLGLIHTPRGDIATPSFMPVGTQASVKTLDSGDLTAVGAQIILGNAYHLHLRPGEDLIAQLGGLHKFMNWPGPILTDSGGFQVFSLAAAKGERTTDKKNQPAVKIDENGATFRSHLDGGWHRFTPKSAMEIQHKIGADIIMAFDQCTRDNASRLETEKAMKRTHRWAETCLNYHQSKNGAPRLFGIVQGGRFKSLRLQSAKFIASLPFDGLAVGGETIGYNMPRTRKIMNWIEPLLPKNKPRYTMGVGFSPADIFTVVEMGVDMFDCVAPTRLARNGALYVSPASGGCIKNKYRLNIANSRFAKEERPLDAWCDCSTCRGYSRAYLHHLFRAREIAALRLATLHNVRFMLKLMEEIRLAVKENKFFGLKKRWT